MINNVLYDVLPEEWNGYKLNMDFQIGVQVMCALEDKELSDDERTNAVLYLLFWDSEAEQMREIPKEKDEIEQLFQWYFNGWNHDRQKKNKKDIRTIDFYIDQWRIYADFRQIYNINLNNCELHWWEFLGMLWNMPSRYSSLMQVIGLRTREPRKKATQEEIREIEEAKQIYGLEQHSEQRFTDEEKAKIDAYDRMMEEKKRKDKIAEEAIKLMK